MCDSDGDDLKKRLQEKRHVDVYRGTHGLAYIDPQTCGYTVINVLPELYGLPLSDLIMAYVHALRPSAVRISTGEQTCDSNPWRVSITVDANDVVMGITQEVRIAYGCGADIDDCLRAARESN